MKNESEKPFTSHLEELRLCLIKVFLFTVLGAVISYIFMDQILEIIVKPAGRLVFLHPTEAFTTKIRTSLYAGVFIFFPFILYEIWKFVIPAFEEHGKNLSIFTAASYLLFLTGSFFGFFIFPYILNFLLKSGTELINPCISFSSYIGFFTGIVLVSGFIFQMPIVFLMLVKFRICDAQLFIKNRKAAVVIIFIIAAVITPPDVISQLIVAIPMVFLYEISIFLTKTFSNKKLRVKE